MIHKDRLLELDQFGLEKARGKIQLEFQYLSGNIQKTEIILLLCEKQIAEVVVTHHLDLPKASPESYKPFPAASSTTHLHDRPFPRVVFLLHFWKQKCNLYRVAKIHGNLSNTANLQRNIVLQNDGDVSQSSFYICVSYVCACVWNGISGKCFFCFVKHWILCQMHHQKILRQKFIFSEASGIESCQDTTTSLKEQSSSLSVDHSLEVTVVNKCQGPVWAGSALQGKRI